VKKLGRINEFEEKTVGDTMFIAKKCIHFRLLTQLLRIVLNNI
jgi:hypothetical protein